MRLLRLAIVLTALVAAIVPLPSRLVEAWYTRGLYPAIQATLTPLSNKVTFALLDVAAGALLVWLLVAFVRRLRSAGLIHATIRLLVTLISTAGAVYLLFLALWGLNYRRVPLEARLQFDESRITAAAARALGEHAAREINATYSAAHASIQEEPSLAAAFVSAQQFLGSARMAVPGVPKRSLLGWYFRTAAIDGMTDPFFLEVMINPDLLPFEQPFVTAHEWAHLAGYAHEAEANFVAWLTCVRGNALGRYSGWFAIYEHVAASLPKPDRSALGSLLDPGPRQDLQASAKRYMRSSPIVRDTTREVYDTYLRANRVNEGIASYSAVVRLMLGAGVPGEGAPRLREPAGYRRARLMPPLVPSTWISGPPPFRLPSSRRRESSVVSIGRPPVSMPPLVMRADIDARASDGSRSLMPPFVH